MMIGWLLPLLIARFRSNRPAVSPKPQSPVTHVDQLIAAKTDRERARRLLQCPQITLAKHATEIRWALRKARFEAGISFLDIEIVALHARRRSSGHHGKAMHRALMAIRRDLATIAGGGPEP